MLSACQPTGEPYIEYLCLMLRWKIWPVFFVMLCLHGIIVRGQPVRRPFPQHLVYGNNIHIPDHIGRQQLDDSVRSFYTAWKNRYLRKGCNPGEYYIWF